MRCLQPRSHATARPSLRGHEVCLLQGGTKLSRAPDDRQPPKHLLHVLHPNGMPLWNSEQANDLQFIEAAPTTALRSFRDAGSCGGYERAALSHGTSTRFRAISFGVGTDSTSSVPVLPVRNALLLLVEEVIGSIRHEHLVADICRRRATVRRRRSAGCIQPLDERCLRQNLAAGGTPLGTY